VDACVTPVLTLGEAPDHPHLTARGTHLRTATGVEPAPVPRFSRTPGHVQAPAEPAGASTRQVLTDQGFTSEEIERLEADGVVVQAVQEGA
jgi:alpha-methylacyl-CoA racemase